MHSWANLWALFWQNQTQFGHQDGSAGKGACTSEGVVRAPQVLVKGASGHTQAYSWYIWVMTEEVLSPWETDGWLCTSSPDCFHGGFLSTRVMLRDGVDSVKDGGEKVSRYNLNKIFFFWDRILCSPGWPLWPLARSVAEDGLENLSLWPVFWLLGCESQLPAFCDPRGWTPSPRQARQAPYRLNLQPLLFFVWFLSNKKDPSILVLSQASILYHIYSFPFCCYVSILIDTINLKTSADSV